MTMRLHSQVPIKYKGKKKNTNDLYIMYLKRAHNNIKKYSEQQWALKWQMSSINNNNNNTIDYRL